MSNRNFSLRADVGDLCHNRHVVAKPHPGAPARVMGLAKDCGSWVDCQVMAYFNNADDMIRSR
jgi:hypothetical protein